MSLEQKGTIHKIFPTEQITDTFKKRILVLSMESGPYTEYPAFEFVQDRCDMLDQYKEGDTVTVNFDLKGREHNGKFYTNLRAWKLSKDGGATQPANAPKNDVKVLPLPDKGDNGGGSDDLPF